MLNRTITRGDNFRIGEISYTYEWRYVPCEDEPRRVALFVACNHSKPWGQQLRSVRAPEGEPTELQPGTMLTVHDCERRNRTRIGILSDQQIVFGKRGQPHTSAPAPQETARLD